jgi:hypothetical protein
MFFACLPTFAVCLIKQVFPLSPKLILDTTGACLAFNINCQKPQVYFRLLDFSACVPTFIVLFN